MTCVYDLTAPLVSDSHLRGQFNISWASLTLSKSRAFVLRCGKMRTGPLSVPLFGHFFGCDWDPWKMSAGWEAEDEDRFSQLRQIPHSSYFWMAVSASLTTYSNGIKTFASVCWVSLFKSHKSSCQCWRQRGNTRAGRREGAMRPRAARSRGSVEEAGTHRVRTRQRRAGMAGNKSKLQ